MAAKVGTGLQTRVICALVLRNIEYSAGYIFQVYYVVQVEFCLLILMFRRVFHFAPSSTGSCRWRRLRHSVRHRKWVARGMERTASQVSHSTRMRSPFSRVSVTRILLPTGYTGRRPCVVIIFRFFGAKTIKRSIQGYRKGPFLSSSKTKKSYSRINFSHTPVWMPSIWNLL